MKKNAIYSVVDVLVALFSSKKNLIYLDSYQYAKMSRAVNNISAASEEEKKRISERFANAKDNEEIFKIASEVSEIAKEKKDLKLVRSSNRFPMNGISFNEKRANVSMNFVIDGIIHLPSDSPDSLPCDFETTTVRNYNVVCDGNLHIESFKASLDASTLGNLKNGGVNVYDCGRGIYEISLVGLPLSSLSTISANDFAETTYSFIKGKISRKVVTYWLNKVKPEISELKNKYGEEATNYLSSIGITDKGFYPKTERAEVKSTYKGIETAVKLKGYSSITSMNAFVNKKTDIEVNGNTRKRFNDVENLMNKVYDDFENLYNTMPEKDFIRMAEKENSQLKHEMSEMERHLAEIRLSLAEGKWYSEFKGAKTNVLSVSTSDGVNATITEDEKEFEI